MAKKPRGIKQYARVDEDFELSEFKISETRHKLAVFTIYFGAFVLCIAALLSLYSETYVPISATAGVVVPLMVLVIRHYFR